MKQLDRYQDMRPDNLVNALRRIEILECALKDSDIDLEKHRALLIQHLSIIDPLRQELEAAKAELSNVKAQGALVLELQAKLNALEKQEPVAYVVSIGNSPISMTCPVKHLDTLAGMHNAPLYLAAGAAQREQP